MGAPGGVEQHDVIALQARGLLGADGDLHRRLAGDDRQRIDADLAPEHGELLLRRRPLDVERGHQHLAFHALGEAFGDFRRRRRLAGALQADHHDGDGRDGIEIDRLCFGAQRLDQHVVDDLDDHLAGRDGFDDIGADGARAHLVDEGAHHVERDVGLEEGAADLAQRDIDVCLRERTAPRQRVENGGELFRKPFEHAPLPYVAEAENRPPNPPEKPTPFAPGGATRCRTFTARLKGRTGSRISKASLRGRLKEVQSPAPPAKSRSSGQGRALRSPRRPGHLPARANMIERGARKGAPRAQRVPVAQQDRATVS